MATRLGSEKTLGRSVLPREDVFVTSKVWNSDQGFDSTIRAVKASLRRLKTSYLDLYLVHWPRPSLMQETWRAMETIRSEGLARSIGVSNFLSHHLDQTASFANEMPVVNQVEFHPLLQVPDVVEACARHGVVVEAWSPLKRGRLVNDPTLQAIADLHGVSTSQVILRWMLQRGIVAIPKSATPERIRANFDVYGYELTTGEMASIDAMDRGERTAQIPHRSPATEALTEACLGLHA